MPMSDRTNAPPAADRLIRVLASERLQGSELRFRGVMDAARVACALNDVDGRSCTSLADGLPRTYPDAGNRP